MSYSRLDARMWRVVWASILVLSAGCIDPTTEQGADGTSSSAPTEPPVPAALVMVDCYEQAASFPVPAEDYSGSLPDGFSIAPYTGGGSLGATPTSDQMGELFVVASQCTGPDGEGFERAFTAAFVTPPEELRNPEAAFGHLLLLGYWTSAESHLRVWQAWGLRPALDDLSLERSDLGAQRTGLAAFPSSGGATLTSQVALVEESMPANTARFFGADETGTTGIADAEFGELSVYLGTATVEGTPETGIQAGPYDGVGFHAFGHSNHWTHVAPPS